MHQFYLVMVHAVHSCTVIPVILVILPELVSEYVMRREGLTYKDATKFIYRGRLPTLHPNDYLQNV